MENDSLRVKALKEILQAQYHLDLWFQKNGINLNKVDIEKYNQIHNEFSYILIKLYKTGVEVDKSDNKDCLKCAMKHILNFSAYNYYESIISNVKIKELIKLIFDLSKENII